MRDLAGRVAVVTGAASGIGLAMVDRFAAEGMRVVLADVEVPALDREVARLSAAGADVLGVPTDVADPEQVEQLAEHAVRRFGAVHLVCNNAGVDSGGPVADIPLAVWQWVFAVNFWGVVHGCRTFLPVLRKQDAGHIVNTASHAALSARFPAGTPYVASKCAVLGLTENLHHELAAAGEPIGVSVLCPSFVDTNMPESERNRPAGVPTMADNPSWRHHLSTNRERAARGLAPSHVAGLVVDAVRDNRFFILPHASLSTEAVGGRLAWMAENRSRPS